MRLRITIKGKRELSRPRRGHFDLLYELLNQAGNVVLSVLVAGLIERRPPSCIPLRSAHPRMTGEDVRERQTPRSLNTPLAILKASRLAGMPQ